MFQQTKKTWQNTSTRISREGGFRQVKKNTLKSVRPQKMNAGLTEKTQGWVKNELPVGEDKEKKAMRVARGSGGWQLGEG